ncbi:MAG: hypothetical protein ACKOPN_06320 [Prochlorococcaceae cyanobacterium]
MSTSSGFQAWPTAGSDAAATATASLADVTELLYTLIESSNANAATTTDAITGLRDTVGSIDQRLGGLQQQLDAERAARGKLEARAQALEQRVVAPSDAGATSRQLVAVVEQLQATVAKGQERQQQLDDRQQALASRLEAVLSRRQPPAPVPVPVKPAGRAEAPAKPAGLPPLLVGGRLGGGLVLLALQAQWRQGTANKPGPALPQAPAAVAPPPPAPPREDRLTLTCPQVCWVEVQSADQSRTLFYDLLRGRARFPLGDGLRVSSGRSDILQIRINDGPASVLDSRLMVSSRLILPLSPSRADGPELRP